MRHEVEVTHKENTPVTPILDAIRNMYQDRRIEAALRSPPHKGVSDDGKKYILYLGEEAAVVLKRVKPDKVKVIIITGRPAEIGTALRAEKIMAPFGLSQPVEKSMRKCLRMALAGEIPDTMDKKDKKDVEDMPDERDTQERPDKRDLRDDEEYTSDDEVYVDEKLEKDLLGNKTGKKR